MRSFDTDWSDNSMLLIDGSASDALRYLHGRIFSPVCFYGLAVQSLGDQPMMQHMTNKGLQR